MAKEAKEVKKNKDAIRYRESVQQRLKSLVTYATDRESRLRRILYNTSDKQNLFCLLEGYVVYM